MPRQKAEPTILGRTLPQNLDAERSVLGAILMREEVLTFISGVLIPSHFFRKAHEHIYTAMLALAERRQAIDFITVREELTRTDLLDAVGGPAYIAALVDGMPRSTNAEAYARIVKDKALLRQLIFNASATIERAYEGEDDPATVLAETEAAVYSLGEQETGGELVGGERMAQEGMDLLERLHDSGRLAGLSTGLTVLDSSTLGLHPDHLCVVAARPGKGKSAFALHLARQIGMTLKQHVAVFSLEMSREELILRMMSSEGRMSGHAMRSGQGVSEGRYGQLTHAINRIGESCIWVDDTPSRTALQIRSQCRRLKARVGGLGCVIIDYLQLMTPVQHKKEATREQEVGAMAWSCKMLAKELHVPVVLLSQLNRSSEDRANQRPQLRDLRESGAIEQHSDDVLFIHPPQTENGTCEVVVGKQRNGPTAVLQVGYDPSQFRFWNLAQE